MKKYFIVLGLINTIAYATMITIKNDTKIEHFITCDKIGHLIEPQKEVQLDIPEVSWLASWWNDPSIITLYKKVGDSNSFDKVFFVTPKRSEENTVVIFISDIQRKARHVSAPFSVKAIPTN